MSELTTRKEGEGSPIQKEMEAVLSSLANEDALKVFQEAKEGITSSTAAIKKLKLTQKRYYARLKPLIETGLIEKADSTYELTFLGKIIYEILYRKLGKALENRDRIALIDKLNKAKSLSKEEKEEISRTISFEDKVIGYSVLIDGIKPVEIVGSYEELIGMLSRLVNNAEREILMATRYTDSELAEAFLRAARRGVRLWFLDGDRANLSDKIGILRTLLLNPKTLKVFHEILSSPQTTVKYVDLPYSFCIIDKKYAGIEIMNPFMKDFFVAFLFDDEKVSEKFIEMFDAFSEKATEDPLTTFFDKLKKKSVSIDSSQS